MAVAELAEAEVMTTRDVPWLGIAVAMLAFAVLVTATGGPPIQANADPPRRATPTTAAIAMPTPTPVFQDVWVWVTIRCSAVGGAGGQAASVDPDCWIAGVNTTKPEPVVPPDGIVSRVQGVNVAALVDNSRAITEVRMKLQ